MKKNKKIRNILLILLFTAILSVAGVLGWRQYQKIIMLREQNYVASCLIELGYYEEGREMASQGEQMRSNDTSRELLVLAAGLQQEYHLAIAYADKFMRDNSTDVLESTKDILQEHLDSLANLSPEYSADSYNSEYQTQLSDLEKATGDRLLMQLLTVQNSISVKKSSPRILAIIELAAGNYYSTTGTDILQDDNSLLARKVQAEYAIRTGDYQAAYVKLESLLSSNPTFETRAAIANLAATTNALSTEDETILTLQSKQQLLYQELSNLQQSYYTQELSESGINRLNRQMENLQEQIDTVQEQINTIPAQKAINFLETTTPLKDRDTVAYRLELAQLYSLAGDQEKSQELLVKILKDDRESLDPASIYLKELIDAYMESTNLIQETGAEAELATIWSRLGNLLHFIQVNYYGSTETDFYHLLISTMDELYNGILIRRIDATGFPVVRVTFNVALELENALEEKDFRVDDMKEPVSDFRLLTGAELEENDSDLSVVLVVDRSGSMGGTPMSDTKQAVTNFIRELDAGVQVGVVAFDDHAEVMAPISNSKTNALRAVNEITAGGGTSIYSGLRAAGQELSGQTGRRVVILLSDGADGSTNSIDEVLAELNRQDIIVYTIGFGGADAQYLTYIAQQCGGKFLSAYSSQVLGEIYSTIGNYMANDYVIEFTAQTDLEDFSRQLRITLKRNDSYSERNYHVGVPLEDILTEDGLRPTADYFRQNGGSDMSAH